MTFKDGEVICRQGEKGAAMFLIIDGASKVVEETEDGEIRIADLQVGAVVGESSVIDGERWTATVKAVGEARCLVLKTGWVCPFNLKKLLFSL